MFTGNFYKLLEKVAVSIVTEVDFSEDGGYRLRRHVKVSNFDVLLTVHLSIFISVINQLDAQNFCFTISLL